MALPSNGQSFGFNPPNAGSPGSGGHGDEPGHGETSGNA